MGDQRIEIGMTVSSRYSENVIRFLSLFKWAPRWNGLSTCHVREHVSRFAKILEDTTSVDAPVCWRFACWSVRLCATKFGFAHDVLATLLICENILHAESRGFCIGCLWCSVQVSTFITLCHS